MNYVKFKRLGYENFKLFSQEMCIIYFEISICFELFEFKQYHSSSAKYS